MPEPDRASPARAIARAEIGALFAALHAEGLGIVGPTVRDGAIMLEPIDTPDQLPIGWSDEQAPAKYRLVHRDEETLFDYVNGPSSWKQVLFPAREPLYTVRRRPDGRLGFTPAVPDAPERAFLGVRACDLAAIHVQDRTFLENAYADSRYAARRARVFVIAVTCLRAGPLCFCASMETGPRVGEGADLVLTELGDTLLVEAGSERGERLAASLSSRPATDDELAARDAGLARATREMGRSMDPERLPEILFGNLDHPRWDDVAARCLSCGNCTQVCPTCFCAGVEERSDLDGAESERARIWESCFTQEHGMIHGLDPRPTILDRYRQWLTHKVGSWVSQTGVSGCVGCGRCIAWCPVGIDLTEEVAAIRASAAPEVTMPRAPPLRRDAAPMEDLVPREAEVVRVHRETDDVVTLSLRVERPTSWGPGQFQMLSLPAIGEAAISIAGGDAETLEHTIRGVGEVSRALVALTPGARVAVRGPYGRGWPLAESRGRAVTVIAGGVGLAPLRAGIVAMLAEPEAYPEVRVIYGARTPADRLYAEELDAWSRGASVEVTVDRAAPSWKGHVGVVTGLLRGLEHGEDGVYFLCGPEIMMRFTIEALSRAGVAPARIHLSMERNMKCAAGFCGRCQYGPYFVCKDGPVFRWDEARLLFGRDGF